MAHGDQTTNGSSRAASGAGGGLVASVESDSPAARAGIRPGDRIKTLDGRPLRDVIDFQFYYEPGRQRVELERGGRGLELEIDNRGAPHPGIVFSNTLFDGVCNCRCNCVFCFVDQLPLGLRDPLYLKDDDYRLSFLYGNFVTLNNLGDEDIRRIVEQRLSPLFVSVHATDPGIRASLMGCAERFARAGLDNLRLLGREGIETHIQVVLCPPVNDGIVLERTVKDLAGDFPAIGSVGVVPVAVGGHCERDIFPGQRLRTPTGEECSLSVEAINGWQSTFRRERGNGFVYAADELYLRAGLPLPGVESYDGFPQYENGVGVAAAFLDEVEELLAAQAGSLSGGGRVFLLTGALALPVVGRAIGTIELSEPEWLGGRRLEPLVAQNRLFGSHVTVTGLLGGADVIDAARTAGVTSSDFLIMPAAVLDSAGERFLDGVTLGQLRERLDCTVLVS